MDLQPPISQAKHSIIINLNAVKLEDIVQKKLLFFLNQKPLGQRILKTFYEPVEQALIEVILQKNRGNQLKTAHALNINRNTLKKKILYYHLDIDKLLTKNISSTFYLSELFLSSISSLNLLTVSHAKLYLEMSYNKLPNNNILFKIGNPIKQTIIHTTLKHFNYNKIKTAYFLGLNRNTLKKNLN
ncbi:MAG: hypothetical protein GDA46_02460 [Bdellovibrionales bacterium]|nr:hypothetical protein [Bdellovibrionales bacterium]